MNGVQMDMFSLLTQLEPEPEALLNIGQKVFIVSLDCVLTAEIIDKWLCRKDDISYYGYRVKYEKGYDCVWDYNIGDNVFLIESEARTKAKQCDFPKILHSELKLTDGVGYEYIRGCDNYKLTSFVAKVGDTQLYEHSFYCYHFLRKYKTSRDRDMAYQEIKDKLFAEAEMTNGVVSENPILEDLYYVSDGLFASRKYAEWRSELNKRLELE